MQGNNIEEEQYTGRCSHAGVLKQWGLVRAYSNVPPAVLTLGA